MPPSIDDLRAEIYRVRQHVHTLRSEIAAINIRLEGMTSEIRRNTEARLELEPLVEQLSRSVERAAAVSEALHERGPVIPVPTLGRVALVVGGILGSFTTALVGLHALGWI